MPTVGSILYNYYNGQDIFRRESVALLVERIEELEKIVATQKCEKSDSEYCYENFLSFVGGDGVEYCIHCRLPRKTDSDNCLLGGKHEWRTLTDGEYTKTICGKCTKYKP